MADLAVKIKSGGGKKGNHAKVTDNDAVQVALVLPDLPPSGTPPRRRPFTAKIDIHNGGTNGSVTPVEYTLVESDPTNTFNYWVQTITVVISDGTQNYSKYGALAALTNGIDIFSEIQGTTDYLARGAKTGGELLILAASGEIFPTNPAAITGWSTNDDALVAVFDLNEQIPEAGGLSGIEIGRGTFDKLCIRINDNLTALSDHFVIVKGFKLYE